jgi:hypothetical protein
MSETTARHQLPYIMPNQAQSHVTHNEALRRLDAMVHISVASRSLPAPPPGPAAGEAYLVPEAGASGAFAGHEEELATFQDGTWFFVRPGPGWVVHVEDEALLLVHLVDGWKAFVSADTMLAETLGINTMSDETNRFALKSDAALFSHAAETGGSGDMRLKLNRQTSSSTASLLFQSAWSGRAEMGLAGDDKWRLKVSADGGSWADALIVDGSTGRVGVGIAAPTALLDVGGTVRMGNYTQAALPDPVASGSGAMACVVDAAAGPVAAFSDGATWHALPKTGFERIHARISPGTLTPLVSDQAKLDFTTVHANQGGGWNTATSSFTAPRPGIYQINATVRYDSLPQGGHTRLFVARNGNEEAWQLGHVVVGDAASNDFQSLTICSALDLAQGDVVTIHGGHAAGGGNLHQESQVSICLLA